jgi:hypothetical protein
MPSLEKHEGWGNQFVVLHEAEKGAQIPTSRNIGETWGTPFSAWYPLIRPGVLHSVAMISD